MKFYFDYGIQSTTVSRNRIDQIVLMPHCITNETENIVYCVTCSHDLCQFEKQKKTKMEYVPYKFD